MNFKKSSKTTDSAGRSVHSPEGINSIFQTFCTNVHSSKQDVNQDKISLFPNNTEFTSELYTVLDNKPDNKAAAEDGFPAAFYKPF